MPIYTYRCKNPKCQKVIDKLVKSTDAIVMCDCDCVFHGPTGEEIILHPEMDLILSVPSPFQWGCPKGF